MMPEFSFPNAIANHGTIQSENQNAPNATSRFRTLDMSSCLSGCYPPRLLLAPVDYSDRTDDENDDTKRKKSPHHVYRPTRPIAAACSGVIFAVIKRPAP